MLEVAVMGHQRTAMKVLDKMVMIAGLSETAKFYFSVEEDREDNLLDLGEV